MKNPGHLKYTLLAASALGAMGSTPALAQAGAADSDVIIVLDRGQIVEQGTHAELLAHEAGHYSRLHRLQQG